MVAGKEIFRGNLRLRFGSKVLFVYYYFVVAKKKGEIKNHCLPLGVGNESQKIRGLVINYQEDVARRFI